MTDTKVARVGRRIAPGQMFITLMVAVALAAVLVSSAAGRARVPESPVVFNLATAQADGFVYVPLTPNRILDTRFNLGLTGPLQSKTPRTFQVTGLHPANVNTNVPADAAAVTGNLTVDKQTAPGFISLTPTPQANPDDVVAELPGGRHARQQRRGAARHGRQAERHVRSSPDHLDRARDLRRHRLLRARRLR